MTDPVFVPGDVVYGAAPFKPDAVARPWLVIENHKGRPFHGDQYIVLALTTRSWHDGLVTIEAEQWLRGGTPEPSRIAPWSVQSLAAADIERWQGRIAREPLQSAIGSLREMLRAE
ncbi:MAG: type II toxin-antitoxin system PemK/MazF family toxin [Halobacteriales archaeon]|nr:type II toxin-antitoxin system PemK/MazF family toxin [Halobacteriales archaeon]